MKQNNTPGLSHTTPFPNELIDNVMPHLNDTQWRVLCVIVRQTLGWHDKQTGSRKIRDWLTQSQLKIRTGRNIEALAAAIDLLVARGYIVVEDESGNPLDSPQKRRAYRGRSYYRLADVWLQRVGLPIPKLPDKELSRVTQLQMRKTEFVGIGKSNRTKEKQTKENQLPVHQSPLPTGEYDVEKLSVQAQKFVALFEQIGGHSLKQRAGYVLFPSDARQLEKLLAGYIDQDWRPIIKLFFASDMEYIWRRQYSLQAFLGTCHIFLLRSERQFHQRCR